MSKKFLVSANYLNRQSTQKWLTREVGQIPEQSVAHYGIIAIGVIFSEATLEHKYGCIAVAHCDQVATYTTADMPSLIPGKFNEAYFHGGLFRDKEDDGIITEVAQLYLHPDGSIYYAMTVVELQTHKSSLATANEAIPA